MINFIFIDIHKQYILRNIIHMYINREKETKPRYTSDKYFFYSEIMEKEKLYMTHLYFK